jgi:hypothetical protein
MRTKMPISLRSTVGPASRRSAAPRLAAGMKPGLPSGAATLPPALAALLRELSRFGGEQTVGPLRAALIALADEALEVDDAAALEFVLARIACQPRSLGARMEAIADILGQRGNVVVTLTRDNYSIQRPA